MLVNYLRSRVCTALFTLAILLLASDVTSAQVTVNLTAQRTTVVLSDGSTVPMWGYFCNPLGTTSGACSALNPNSKGWSPISIVVPAGQGLTINLTNSLPVETSVTIVGQLNGPLGSPMRESGPRNHPTQTATTWTTVAPGSFTPPDQANRARSFVQEAPAGGKQTYSWTALSPGTYLLETGTYPSIQGPMGLYGVVVVTNSPLNTAANGTTPASFTPGTAYPGLQYDADAVLLLSEIDPVQNAAADTAVQTAGFSATAKWTPACAKAHTCYPAAVNYTPLYFLINGQSFDNTQPGLSALQVPGNASTGNVLLRFVNAGSHMHVPSVAGLNMSLIAEDGNLHPDVALAISKNLKPQPKIQNEVFLSAGKRFDVMVSPPQCTGTSADPPSCVLPSSHLGAGNYQPAAYSVFDRSLDLSANNHRDSGMQAFLQVNGGALPAAVKAVANPDAYFFIPSTTTSVTPLVVSDPSKGVIANDVNVAGVQLLTAPTGGTVVLNYDGTFTYTPAVGTSSDSFIYYANGNPTISTKVTLSVSPTATTSKPTANPDQYSSKVASFLKVSRPGVLSNDTDPYHYTLTAVLDPCPSGTANPLAAGQVSLNPDGSFTATPSGAGTYTFCYHAVNSENAVSNTTTVTLVFPAGSNLAVSVVDAQTKAAVSDYSWIIEEDRTFKVDPNAAYNTSLGQPTSLALNFHTSYMPVVAQGCVGPISCGTGQSVYDPNTGSHVPAACDAYGVCTTGATSLPSVTPDKVALDPSKYYYISILPGDAANAMSAANTLLNPPQTNPAGHTMGGAPISPGQLSVTVNVEPNPLPPAQITIYVFADDNELNGEVDSDYQEGGVCNFSDPCPGGGEPGLGGFQLELFDVAGSSGDAIGQMTYDMFNMPLTNALAGTIDPVTGLDACPLGPSDIVTVTSNILAVTESVVNGLNTGIATLDRLPGGAQIGDYVTIAGVGVGGYNGKFQISAINLSTNTLSFFLPATTNGLAASSGGTATLANLNNTLGVIMTCPDLEADGKTFSPLRGHAVVKNLMPGRFSVVARPGAQRIANGEEWIQTNTLDGQRGLDAFARPGEPAYFQEYGPAGLHVFMGFVNPKMIQGVLQRICSGTQSMFGTGNTAPGSPIPCNNTIKGQITNLRFSRPPDERLADSAVNPEGDPMNRSVLASSTCYVSLGVLDSPNIAFTKCDGAGNFSFSGIPDGSYSVTVFDQYLHQLMFEKEIEVAGGKPLDMGTYPVFNWFINVQNKIFLDLNGNGIQDDPVAEPGLIQVPVRIRFRNGKFSNTLFTTGNGDPASIGTAVFDETFPLFNWYTIESDNTRFKGTGVHVVYDAGGAPDKTGPYAALLNSSETVAVPSNLRVPGAVYCGAGDAACKGSNLGTNPQGGGTGGSTGRIDPGSVVVEGVQGFAGQTQIIEWGKAPYAVGENGGIVGHVVYSSTRPFDDPAMLFQNLWEPLVPGVTINLYQEGTGPNGQQTLTLVDTTKTSSWDDWANGTHLDATGNVVPNMSCPGQDPTDPFLSYTLGAANQFKCYDGMHNFNQIQPAPYDGRYQFPSTNCTICVANPANPATKVLPAGKYVVEEVTPPGYEVVKEEDKNILSGDAFIAPAVQQFAPIINIFIVPDQASVNASNPSYTGPWTDPTNPYNPVTSNNGNPTSNMGRTTFGSFGPGALIVQNAPCVGNLRIVPDYMSIFPQAGLVAAFAGSSRHLCDRKEVTLADQMQANADFFIFTRTHAASHFTGFILDDFSSEFDPTSPDFGEKFAVPNLPVAIRDPFGIETSRVYSDQWGIFDGLTYSTWEVNPPNPAGYSPNMMITCMNDPGPISGPNGTLVNDPLFNPQYSDFCYENPFMPADTDYLDTPVVPVSAFADGYNPVDCAYPDATPAISRVDGNGGQFGPYLDSSKAMTLTIQALGDVVVPNNAYSGPGVTLAPFNQKTITRHYGFGRTQGTVTIGGVQLNVTSWADNQIIANVPPTATTGELVIQAANGNKSIDTVTVTIENSTAPGYKAPTYVTPGMKIQDALDAAQPGDLIIVNGTVSPTPNATPGTTCNVPGPNCTATGAVYPEMLIMWKPVRLQGVGAASATVNANPHPAGKLDAWRSEMRTLFGLDQNGFLANVAQGGTPPAGFNPTIDILPGEMFIGVIQADGGLEPDLMSIEEGGGITVVGKNQSASQCGTQAQSPSNFYCAPSRIDGLGFTNSQAGGGIYVHGWGHNVEISNNRVFGNGATITGGIHVGQVEVGADCGSAPYLAPCNWDANIYIHNNAVTHNTAFGDEFNTDTPAAGGGISLMAGSDNYRIQQNLVCGNLSTGDGGGINHYGLSTNGNISHNQVIFNQSFNQTITTAGGGISIQGSPNTGNCEGPPAEPACANQLSPGTGNVVVDANLIQGNLAEGGSGGGIRLQEVNGNDVSANRTQPSAWWHVDITNNMIVNNIASWAGGGISLYDAASVSIVNNTIVSNDTTSTAGILFDTVGAPNGNVPSLGLITTSNYEPAGVEAELHGPALQGAFGPICAAGQVTGCIPATWAPNTKFSNPLLTNNIIHQNRTFYMSVGNLDIKGVQNSVQLNPALSVGAGYECPAAGVNGGSGPNYWDIGVLGDTSQTPGSNPAGYKLSPTYSILDDPNDYPTTALGQPAHNKSANPQYVRQYCNGSRTTPGIPDIDPFYPLFTLTPAATVDEGNNWVNLRFGPLSLSDSSIMLGGTGYGTPLGDYHLTAGSPAIDAIPTSSSGGAVAPNHDFDGNPRPDPANPNAMDIGAVEFVGGASTASVTGGPLAFGQVVVGKTSASRTLTLHNTSSVALSGISITITPPFARAAAGGNCGTTLAANSTCTINVVFQPTLLGAANGSVSITAGLPVSGAPVALTGAGFPQLALTPVTWTPAANRGVTTMGPTQVFMLTNNTNAPVTGITHATLSGANSADFAILGSVSTCGPVSATQPVGKTSLAVGANCTVTVQFRPLASEAAGMKNAILSVTDSGGTQSSTLVGTAK